jgi:predicted RNase H-like nuclease (RuvC/YqgF family)
MPEEKEQEKERRPLSTSEKIKNYCVGIGALTALILGLWANLRGEPKAQRSWDQSRSGINTTRRRVNALAEQVHKLQLRIISLQASQEGYNSGKLWAENQRLQATLEELRKKPRARPAPPEIEPLATRLAEEKAKRRKLEKALEKAPPPPAPMPQMQQRLAD